MPPTEPTRAVNVLLVTSTACHYCEMAKDVLGRLAAEYSIRLREVDMMSDEGRSIVRRHQIPFPPAILVDGRYHSHGRVSEKKLRMALDLVTGGR